MKLLDKQHFSNQPNQLQIQFVTDRGRPDDINAEEEARQQFIIGNDETDLELSVESRSFVNGVNDQVQRQQKRTENIL